MGIKSSLTVFSNAVATGNGSDVTVNNGGTYALTANGTWGGSTFKLQIKGPNGTGYIDVPNTSLTADGVVSVDLFAGAIVRGVLTGGAPAAIYASLGFIG